MSRQLKLVIDTRSPRPFMDREVTPREKEIMLHVACGETNKDIAQKLFLSTETVKAHLRNILRKLHARSRAHAIAILMTDNQFREDLKFFLEKQND